MTEKLLKRYALDGATTTEAINKRGEKFTKGELVQMVDYPVLYAKMVGQTLEVLEVYTSDHCASGFMIHAAHHESKNKFRSLLDADWFQKLKTT